MILEVVHSVETTVTFIELSVADLSEQEMVEQPQGVPNHAAWTLGHIIFSCQGIAAELGAEEWLPDHWESTFGYGSTPSSNLSDYPSRSELLGLLTDAVNRLRHTLVALDGAALKQPLPDETFPTWGHLLLHIAVAHTAYHAGQLAVWRRAIGKDSAAVFI